MIIYSSTGKEIKIRRGQFIKAGSLLFENQEFKTIEKDSIVDCLPEKDDMGIVIGFSYFLKNIS